MDGGTEMTTSMPAVRDQALRELGSIVLGEQSLTDVLVRVTEISAGVLPDARDVSVTLVDDRHGRASKGPTKARSVAFHRDLAVDLDERQYQDGHGPCLDAAVSGMTILVDTAKDDLYPEFSAAARHRD